MKLSGSVSAYCVLKDLGLLILQASIGELFGKRHDKAHAHAAHVHLHSCGNDALAGHGGSPFLAFSAFSADEGIIAPPARFVNSFFEKFFLCRLNMNWASVSRKDLLSKTLWCKIYI